MSKKKQHWTEMGDWLSDDGGNSPSDLYELAELMDDFRNGRGIQDYWFADTSEPGEGEDRNWYPDPWHNNEMRESSDVGPEIDDIDYDGIDEYLKGGAE